jgi:glycosyltransferase involved in cell wall biosynthesis
MNSSLVSVCIPVHNVTRFLDEAIASVLTQTYGNFELVIANGASQPEPRRLIEEIVSRNPDPRVQLILNPANFSMVENWNSVIMNARGIYLKLLCADDVLMPDCLERQVQALQEYPNVVLAAGSRVIINRKGNRLFTMNGIGATGVYAGRDAILRCILSGTNIIGDPVNVLWRRSAMGEAGKFDPDVLYCTDVEYWLRLLSEGDLFYDREPVGYYRIHASASANALTGVTVEDFLRTTNKTVQKGVLRLSCWQMRLIRFRSWYKNILRNFVYRFLG